MIYKQVVFGRDAREKIKEGIDIACNAIKSTIGPKGRNVFIDNELQPTITNDGVTIAEAINLRDPLQHMGAWLVKNTSAETNEGAGDGTSTTAVLLQSMIDESLRRPESPMDIKRDLARVGKTVEEQIISMSRPVEDSQIESVATISSESPEIGKLIAEVIAKVGKQVPIYIEDSRSPETEYVIQEGLETKVGYPVKEFVTNAEEGTAEFDNVRVFASDRRIGSLPELNGLLQLCDKEKITELVFLVSDMENPVLGTFVLNKQMGRFKSLVVKVRGNELEDMASVCGATVISDSSGIKFADVKLEHLGFAKRIVATDKKTLIIADPTDRQKSAVAMLRLAATSTKNIYEAKAYNKRADALEGGVAIIRVGAHTDTERTYLKLKIEDAVNATKSALEEGLVEGGGMCLYRIACGLTGDSIGETILRTALKAPFKAIIENAGEEYASVVSRTSDGKGYDANSGQTVDMFTAGIVDPAKVERCAFQNALSTASTFITSEVAISRDGKDKEEIDPRLSQHHG